MAIPKISVIMPAYNHESFVATAIDSVLTQTFRDYEFLIADDGSDDGTVYRIRQFSDPRIHFWSRSQNHGASAVVNELIRRAQGNYVAIINSDDAWTPDKLAFQFEFLERENDYAAVFGQPTFIDVAGKVIKKEYVDFGAVFDEENKAPETWLRHFFEKGNRLCHPTVLMRRKCYQTLGLYDNRLRQLPDFDMWVRLVKHFKIYVSNRKLVLFRVRPGENASSPNESNRIRDLNENFLIRSRFFDGITSEYLSKGFGDLLIRDDWVAPERLEIEKGLLYFSTKGSFQSIHSIIGLAKLHELLSRPNFRSVLNREYGIDDLWFQNKMGECRVFSDQIGIIASQIMRRLSKGWLRGRFKSLLKNRGISGFGSGG